MSKAAGGSWNCLYCNKQILGGFPHQNGYLCAICTVRRVERENDQKWLAEIESEISKALSNKSRPTKGLLRSIKNKIKALREIRK